jgi:hypothetical protein
MELEWNLRYFRWVIEDGEPERHVGDVFEWFAISLWSDAALTRVVKRTKSAVPIGDNSYRVNAEVIYISHDSEQAACVLDFGICAISNTVDILPPECQEGEFVTGEVLLELPLCTKISPHALDHRWRVNRISADLTPYVQDSVTGWFIRDASQVRYQDVVDTNSVHANSYVLHCSDLNP